jgi:sigma-B regulation protein RsbU (phosphoserine phosphatase)
VKILVAEDEQVSRHALEARLRKWGFVVTGFANGTSAWEALQADDAPHLVILDWLMPGMDGIEICRRIRAAPRERPVYIILLTGRTGRENLIQGLEAGADDYVTKPFDFEELRARVQVGVRVVELQMALAERVRELEEALSRVKQLQGLLPICSYCKKIRDDRNYWQQVEGYISEHSEAQFSHGICPECFEKYVRPELESLEKEGQKER